MAIDKSQLKVRVISLATLKKPSELYAFFKSFNAVYYVYGFLYKGMIIKYGESTSQSRSTIFGERVVRQAANITTGWGTDYKLPVSSNGDDMMKICAKFKEKYGIDINRNDVEIIIYDMTEYNFENPEFPEAEVKQLEAEKLSEFNLFHGRLPIGNVKPERAALTLKRTSPATLKKLFNS